MDLRSEKPNLFGIFERHSGRLPLTRFKESFIPNSCVALFSSTLSHILVRPLWHAFSVKSESLFFSAQKFTTPVNLSDMYKREYNSNGLRGMLKLSRKLFASPNLAQFSGSGICFESMSLVFREEFKKFILPSQRNEDIGEIWFFKNASIGFLASGTSAFIWYPHMATRNRIIFDNMVEGTYIREHKEFNGLTDCFVKTFKKHGVFGLFRGFTRAFIALSVHGLIYFGLYDSMKDFYNKRKKCEEAPILWKLCMAQVSVVVANHVLISLGKRYRDFLLLCLIKDISVNIHDYHAKLDAIRSKLSNEMPKQKKIKVHTILYSKLLRSINFATFLVRTVPPAVTLVLFEELMQWKFMDRMFL